MIVACFLYMLMIVTSQDVTFVTEIISLGRDISILLYLLLPNTTILYYFYQ